MTAPKVLLILALLLAACGGAPSTGTLADAVEETLTRDGLAVELEGSVTVGLQTAGGFSATGEVEPSGRTRRLEVNGRPMGAAPFDVTVVAGDGLVFQQGIPGFDDDGWVFVESAPAAITADLPTFVDPLAVLGLVDGLEGAVTDEGEEIVGGVTTQRIGVVLPSGRLQRLIGDQVEALGEVGEDLLDLDQVQAAARAQVWIDDDGLVRQLRVDITAELAGGRVVPGIGVTDTEVLLRLAPLDEAPEVEVPPEGTVVRTRFADLFRTGQAPQGPTTS